MRLLIIEDDERLLSTLTRVLTEEGHSVSVSETGPGGLAAGVADEFDVIVLDVMLPGLDGNLVCRGLRAANVQTPVLMLTALGDVDRKVEGFESGADDYLTKPFSFKELLARISALHRRSGATGSTPDVLAVEDLTLDLRTHSASRAGEDIELTATEFRLLEFLMRNADLVLSRGRLLDAVWGFDYDGESNVVDTYIHSLRSKIDFTTPHLIQTMRGAGYALRGGS